jgi:hypothetical protein
MKGAYHDREPLRSLQSREVIWSKTASPARIRDWTDWKDVCYVWYLYQQR